MGMIHLEAPMRRRPREAQGGRETEPLLPSKVWCFSGTSSCSDPLGGNTPDLLPLLLTTHFSFRFAVVLSLSFGVDVPTWK